MEVKEFEMFLEVAKMRFENLLEDDYPLYDGVSMKMIKKFLKGSLDECCSTFEEETLKEVLRETFQGYLDGLAEKQRIGA